MFSFPKLRHDDGFLSARQRGLTSLAASLVGVLVLSLAATPKSVSHVLRTLQVDPNNATSGLLEALPRVGPSIANRIIAERKNGPFVAVDDIGQRVKGLGKVAVREMRAYLRFDSDPAASVPDRANSK